MIQYRFDLRKGASGHLSLQVLPSGNSWAEQTLVNARALSYGAVTRLNVLMEPSGDQCAAAKVLTWNCAAYA